MNRENRNILFIALVTSLGGFLFGFDASVISGVVRFITVEFDLNEWQVGWAVASLTFASTFTMIFVGPASDRFGRKQVLLFVGLFYAVSALGSALATSFLMLSIFRLLGGLAVGASLLLAPVYIAEITPAGKRGKMVTINQLNIVLGFSAAYFSNYLILQFAASETTWVSKLAIDREPWRWMLGVEVVPALLFFILLNFVPRSPRWLLIGDKEEEARKALSRVNRGGIDEVVREIRASIEKAKKQTDVSWRALLNPSLKKILTIGVVIGIIQQITGVNAIFFYAPTIFEQSGIGTNASFSQAIWVGIFNVVFTLLAMYLIDRIGRKPLLVIGLSGIFISMLVVGLGFNQATFQLDRQDLDQLEMPGSERLDPLVGVIYPSDLDFKAALNEQLGEKDANRFQADLIQASIDMNAGLILAGILGFVASFAISLGAVMWVLFSEIFPNYIRGICISFVGFINSVVSYLVQQLFPWELSHLGSANTFYIYGFFGLAGLLFTIFYLPETKGRSLEELEDELMITADES